MPEIAKREDAVAERYEKQRSVRKRIREVMSRERVDDTKALITLHDEDTEVFE